MTRRGILRYFLSAAVAMSTPLGAQTRVDSMGIWVSADEVRPGVRIMLDRIVRIGGVEGEPDRILASGGPVAVDVVRQEVFVFDGLDHRVKVFSEGGVFLRAWGRQGEGPGEFEAGVGITYARDTVLVCGETRVEAFDRNGNHLATVTPRARLRITLGDGVSATENGWRLALREIEPGVTGSNPFRRVYSFSPRDGIPLEWLYQEPHPGPGPSPILVHKPISAFHGGGVVDAPSGAYELRILGLDGGLRSILRFTHEPVPVASSTKRDYERIAWARCREHPVPSFCQSALDASLPERLNLPLPSTRPVVGALIGSMGNLILVRRADLDSTPFEPGDENHWDLVHDNGRWLGTVDFPVRFEPEWLGESAVWGIERDELDVPYLVGLAFRWPSH